jgi:hypothetical protein
MSPAAGTRVEQLGRRVRVLIADDHQVIRKIVRSTLEVHPQLEVCGEAADGAQAIEAAKKLKPDAEIKSRRGVGEGGGIGGDGRGFRSAGVNITSNGARCFWI